MTVDAGPRRCGNALACEIVPHAVPFLFVDRILSIENDRARILRGVTRNDALLCGYTAMPPVLIVEAIAQAAGVLIASVRGVNALGSLTAIDEFTFHGQVHNGDRLILDVKIRRVHAPFYGVAGRALVDGELRADGKLTLSSERPWHDPTNGLGLGTLGLAKE